MAKKGMVHARMDAALKENVERIFSQIGLNASDAIGLFYRQVELCGGLPFEIKLPRFDPARLPPSPPAPMPVPLAVPPSSPPKKLPRVDVDEFKRELKEMGMRLGEKENM